MHIIVQIHKIYVYNILYDNITFTLFSGEFDLPELKIAVVGEFTTEHSR